MFPRPCSLDHTQDVDATLTWGGVGSDVNVPSATFPRPCARCWCYPQMLMLRSHGVGWGCKPSFDHVPSTLRKMLMLRSDVDATLTWGGVGWGCKRSFNHVPSTLRKMLMLRSHGVGWGCKRSFNHVAWTLRKMLMLRLHGVGGVGWGHAYVHPPLHKALMLHQRGGVGWGDDNAHTTLRKMFMLGPRWSNYHASRRGGVGAFCSSLLGCC